ncbi:MAG: hypothetical protein COU35_02055 [Candidatus Magasanikbacteria bacterium CG10_big_fil_rev_8_21_14_0_10_47_10]|uniref:Uncharacterized protein n=1 Tax=Candidatus Magasanikbacteria bacterium CG10_big_fil_rev_8_21_14_0_10_47_10 TaxID=1974652 RepID=A0A2H0TSL5_9BACT|nr:MAG: hypothetical protein COU35_02055 [Candidatus Magasanikbacteria bacterium CG10_big_fil_rev_8_21_14_0_10_47_10]
MSRIVITSAQHYFFSDLPAISIESAVQHGIPYSDGSIATVNSTNPHWIFWKNVTCEYGGSTGAAWLTKQKEWYYHARKNDPIAPP